MGRHMEKAHCLCLLSRWVLLMLCVLLGGYGRLCFAPGRTDAAASPNSVRLVCDWLDELSVSQTETSILFSDCKLCSSQKWFKSESEGISNYKYTRRKCSMKAKDIQFHLFGQTHIMVPYSQRVAKTGSSAYSFDRFLCWMHFLRQL